MRCSEILKDSVYFTIKHKINICMVVIKKMANNNSLLSLRARQAGIHFKYRKADLRLTSQKSL